LAQGRLERGHPELIKADRLFNRDRLWDGYLIGAVRGKKEE
jgi:hypothetical protein